MNVAILHMLRSQLASGRNLNELQWEREDHVTFSVPDYPIVTGVTALM